MSLLEPSVPQEVESMSSERCLVAVQMHLGSLRIHKCPACALRHDSWETEQCTEHTQTFGDRDTETPYVSSLRDWAVSVGFHMQHDVAISWAPPHIGAPFPFVETVGVSISI